MVSASQRHCAVRHLQTVFGTSERRACQVLRISRTTFRYCPQREPQTALRRRIVKLARARIRYGYRCIHVLLKREGIHVNKKRMHRLYCLEGLQLAKRRKRRHVSSATRQHYAQQPAKRPNESWAMDFVSEPFQTGERIRMLTIIDTHTRECLCLHADKNLVSTDVVDCLNRIAYKKGFPDRIHCDNGSEFAGRLVDLWAYQNQVRPVFSRPGKPTDNAFIESFNGSLRDECLNLHWFESLMDAKMKLQGWVKGYNESLPHRALNDLTPLEFVEKFENNPARFA